MSSLDLIDQIRSSVPEEVRRAEACFGGEGQGNCRRAAEGGTHVAQAEEYAAKLIRESEIHRQAEAKAHLERSRTEQKRLPAGEDYADRCSATCRRH